MKTGLKQLLIMPLALLATLLHAETLDEILAMSEPPVGVVVEVIEPGAAALEQTISVISQAAIKIRQKFPALPVAVVSHGVEQFILTSNSIEQHQSLKSNVQKLVGDDVDLHVCGTHASWRGITPEEYPDYIDVSPAGPAQINDYLNLGYVMLDL